MFFCYRYTKHTGDILETYWRHTGDILETYWRHTGDILETYWKVTYKNMCVTFASIDKMSTAAQNKSGRMFHNIRPLNKELKPKQNMIKKY